MHVISPVATLNADPLPGAVALVPLREALASSVGGVAAPLPEGAERLALEIDGTESQEQLLAASKLGAVVALLNVADGTRCVLLECCGEGRGDEALSARSSCWPPPN